MTDTTAELIRHLRALPDPLGDYSKAATALEALQAENKALEAKIRCRPGFEVLPAAFKDTAP